MKGVTLVTQITVVEEDLFPLLVKQVRALNEDKLDISELSIPQMNWLMLPT